MNVVRDTLYDVTASVLMQTLQHNLIQLPALDVMNLAVDPGLGWRVSWSLLGIRKSLELFKGII